MGCMLYLSTGNDIKSYMILFAYSVVSTTIDPYICNASVSQGNIFFNAKKPGESFNLGNLSSS